jgi:hypothetical protein
MSALPRKYWRYRRRAMDRRKFAKSALATAVASVLGRRSWARNPRGTPFGGSVVPPTFSPVAGSYSSSQSVAISCATAGSSIYYTTDDSTPTYPITGTTQIYTAAITVSSSQTVNAIGVAGGLANSAVASAAYTITGGFAITLPTIPAIPVNGSGFYQLSQTGGVAPITWTFDWEVEATISATTATTDAVFTVSTVSETNPFTGQTQCTVAIPVNGSWPKTLYSSGAITGLGGSSGAWTITTTMNFSNGNSTGPAMLCAGLGGVNSYQMSLTGCLEVAPTTAEGPVTLPVIATDNTGATATANISVTTNTALTILGCALEKAVTPLPGSMQSNAYQHQMTCAGGTGSGQSWSATGLPSGHSMSTAGNISGAPTENGTFNDIVVTLVDSAAVPVSATFSMVVAENTNVSRPSYNSSASNGFFVDPGGILRDPNGAVFRIRGMNQNHYDSDSYSVATAFGCNTQRVFMYLVGTGGNPASTYEAVAAEYVSLGILPVITMSYVPNTMTRTSGDTSTADLATCVDWWVANVATFAPIMDSIIINIANEWDGDNTAATWESSYVSAVENMRTAGYTCPLLVDACGDGQSYEVIVSSAAAVLASDTLKNTMFSFHAYGGCMNAQAQITGITPGATSTVIAFTNAGAHNTFANFIPGVSPSGSTDAASTVYIDGVDGMTQINGLSPPLTGYGSLGEITVTLDSSAFSPYTSGGTIYSGDHYQLIIPALAALASSGVCVIVGEFGPGKYIGTSDGSPTLTSAAQIVSECEAQGLGWMYWAIDDNDLTASNVSQNWFGACLVNGTYAKPTSNTNVGLDAAWNPTTGVHALATPASVFL